MFTKAIDFVDRAENDAARFALSCDLCDVENGVEESPIVDLDHVIPARDAHRLQHVAQQRRHLGVCRHARRPNGVRVALVELPEPPRPRLLVAPDRTHRVAAVGHRQVGAVLGVDAGQRRGHVVAQGQPVAVRRAALLPGEHALVGAVHVGQELAQRLDGLHGGRLQRLEAVQAIDVGDLGQHRLPLGHLRAEIVAEPARGLRRRTAGLVSLRHRFPFRACAYWPPPAAASDPGLRHARTRGTHRPSRTRLGRPVGHGGAPGA